ncbi:MAG TPA: glycosyl hydrolase, partial [Clostridia bacterium]|nr:glycosyl hydrolase [Clostridia bacterium]
VMMCYNLYGTHSGPGPKADPAFLQKMVKGMQTLPGKKSFALATGGFDWTEKGKVVSLTYLDALALQRQHAASAMRDAESGCLVFAYRDDMGKAHDVWYADSQTLRLWMDTIEAMGAYDVNIWRLGGNNPWCE